MSPKEKIEILEDFYGCYIVKEFLLTKFYPALDTNEDVILPNSEIMQRLENGYWVKEVEIFIFSVAAPIIMLQ